MSTRKIKNAKDVTTDELIYFKSHAQATFMSDGTTVEDAINNLQQGTDVNSVYVTDFTIQDLVDLRNTQDVEFIFVDKSSLSAALAEQKLILVRESSDETVKGYHILTGYEDDLMYLTIHDYGSNSYYIETAHSQDNDSFYKNEVGQVIVQERLVTGNNIKSVCGESLVDGVGDITPSFLSVGSTNPHILNLPFGFQNGRYFCKDLESNVRTLVCNLSSDYYYGYISVAREYHPPVLLSLRDIANTETAIASQTFTIYYDSTSHDVYVTAGMSGKVHIRSCSGITKLPKDWYATFIDLTIDAGQEEFRRFLNNNNYDNLLGVTVRLSNDNAETVVFTITNVSGDGINDVMLSGAGPAYSVQTNTFDYTDFSTLTFTKTPFSSGGNTGASAPAFGTCVDAVAVVNKTVQVSGDFPTQLVDNTRVSVLFQYANLAANPTMNVNGTGAYPIMWKNANTASWIANQIYDFVYYNECWYLLGGVDTDTNTDTKVTTSVTTTNNTFPLLFTYTANKANNIAEAARFATDLKYNPATKELTHGGLSFTDSNGNNVSLPTVTESTTLVAENNLKTINGESIVGNGDITVSGGSGGITIVNSVDELDADAPTGTLACVVEGGGGGSVSIRDLSTVTMNDMDENGFIITEGLPQVSGIAIEPYALADIDNLVKLLSELDMTALSGEAGV